MWNFEKTERKRENVLGKKGNKYARQTGREDTLKKTRMQ